MRVRKVFAMALSLLVAVTSAGVASSVATTVASASTPPTNTWPEAHQNPQLTGVSYDPAISDTNAGQLGVHWMSNLAAQSLTSPVVSYNQQLGMTLVYAGSEGGWFSAFDAATGATVWSVNVGSAVRATPAIDGIYIWVANTFNSELMKLNAATGAQIMVSGKPCQAPVFSVAEASPIVVTPPGGIPTVYMGSNDTTQPGPIYSIDEATCVVNWTFTGFLGHAGIWDMMSYAVNANGVPVVLFGTADPDASIYAINALTGKLVWAYATHGTNTLADVGSGVTVALPGTPVGGADGMTFTPSKDGYVYAIDLTTGVEKWEYSYAQGLPVVGNGARDTAALSGTDLVFGTTTGTFDLNALTGAVKWQQVGFPKGDEVLGAPAVTGPAGHQVVLITDIFGTFKVLSLATGAQIYSYQTHNYLASSPAEFDGNVLITAADGFLYDFSLGGGNTCQPNTTCLGPLTTTITAPAQGSTVANPGPGPLVISGTASDPTGVQSVSLAVQEDGQTGTWWSSSTQAWQAGPFNNPATLASPGATTTTWTLTVQMPSRGTVIVVRSSAANTANIADTSSDASAGTPARIDFTVAPSTTAPTLSVGTARVAPGATLMVSGGGYQAGENVAVTLPTSPITTLATIVAGPTGLLASTPITVPVGLNFGPFTVTATGQTSGLVGSAPVIISNNWDQFGNLTSVNNKFINVPAQTNFEINDSALNNNVAASGRYFLNLAYNFSSAAAVHSTVAIDNGHAFFGDDAGDFYSIDVHSGAPTWTKTYTAGIDSSAAVNSSMVIFGTKANSIVAINEAAGTPIWTSPTTAPVESSPVVYGGVVYVGSDDGTFYAINEQTGAVLWTKVLGGAVLSSPAIDPVHSTVVIGDQSGHVTALSLGGTGVPAAGSVVWSALTGAAVVAAPTYFSNSIFVGSTDGKEYAFNAKTGAQLWTFTTGGKITANNVTFGKSIAVGSWDGTIYYLDARLGTAVHTPLAGRVPVVGLTGSVTFAIATLANGAAEGTRITGVDQTWKYNAPTRSLGFASAPVPNNGNIYMTGLDGSLLVFSGPGRLIY